MVFGLGNKALLRDPKHYASPRKHVGAPPTLAWALRSGKAYDYVIVGGGTAGSVLASRLSEDPTVTVLVLEAGGDSRGILESQMPIGFGKLFHGQHDWDYYTVPQSKADNREQYWPRGRVLGGSSSMNAMTSHTCDRQDFDEWKTKFGCEGWGYNDLLPYMRKSEKFTPNPNRPAINIEHRGDSGPWQTGYSWLSEVGEKGFLGACQEVGIKHSPDINTPEGTLGCTRSQTFIDSRGQRSSTATAYLPQTVINRPNLDIAIGVRATRVLFDITSSTKPQAIGVELKTTSTSPAYEVFAKKEVLLCGGSINSPQTLLLSGIGPEDELSKHRIAVIKQSNGVGKNLKDHFCSSPIFAKCKPGTTLDYLNNDLKALPSLVRWMITGGGPLTSNVLEAIAFCRSSDPPSPVPQSETPKDYGSGGIGPDFELAAAPMYFANHGEDKAPPNVEGYTIAPVGLRPQSIGAITLRSKDAFDHPLIDPRYWSDSDDNDRKVLIVGLRICLKILRSEAMRPYLEPVEPNDDINSEWWPYSSSNIDAITDDQLRRFMGRAAGSLYHPIGTARMGPQDNSVVDLQCRVHGVDGLRVIDASIFPEQLSGHPTAPIIAIAEKMSDTIKGVSSINHDATRVVAVDSRVPLPARL